MANLDGRREKWIDNEEDLRRLGGSCIVPDDDYETRLY